MFGESGKKFLERRKVDPFVRRVEVIRLVLFDASVTRVLAIM